MSYQATPMHDAELLSRVGRGDRTAFGEFYDRYAPRVFALLIRWTGNRGDAEDVLQEAFAYVWRKAQDYDPDRAGPLVWLTQIARSRAIDQLRKSRNRIDVEAKPEKVTDGEVADTIAEREMESKTLQALRGLPEDQQEVIRMAYFAGMTHEEIARRQGVPLGTIKSRIRRGMILLRQNCNGQHNGY